MVDGREPVEGAGIEELTLLLDPYFRYVSHSTGSPQRIRKLAKGFRRLIETP